MSFFDVRMPEPPAWEPRVHRPEWSGPPRGVVPGYSPQRAVIFRDDVTLLLAHRFLCYPTGVEFELSLLLGDEYAFGDIPWELHSPPRGGTLPEDFLRFGVLFSDGQKWTNLDWSHPHDDEEPSGPVVWGRGGGGGGDSWEMRYWLWPLPPAGPLTFFAEWPTRGMPESRAEVDATDLRDQAQQAEVIWPD